MKKTNKHISLLYVLLIITLLVISSICTLLICSSQSAIEGFENYIIRNNQQEMDAAVQAFTTDVQSLLNQMGNVLHGSALNGLRQYYASNTYNYSFLEKCVAVQNQISIIDNSMSLAEGTCIYLLNEKRQITSGSVYEITDEEIRKIRENIDGYTQRIVFANRKIVLYRAPEATNSAAETSIVGSASFSSYALSKYLEKHLPTSDGSEYAVFFDDGGKMQSLLSENWLNEQTMLQLFEQTEEMSGAQRYSFQGKAYLLTWQQVPSVSMFFCRLTPFSVISDQMNSYRIKMLAICVMAILVLLLLDLSLYWAVLRPVRSLDRAFSAVGKGKLDVRIGSSSILEFQRMYDQFHSMTVQLQELIDREYTLKLLNTKMELKQLRYQISPHFLYNSYFNLRAMLASEDYDLAEEMALVLGKYLRYITTSDVDEATLQEELEHASAYMQIQKMRFGSRLETHMDDCPQELMNRLIPRIIIQPLLENAFTHGIRDLQEKGIVSVEISHQDQRLSIYVDDNGQKASDEMIAELQAMLENDHSGSPGESVALYNINRRLRLLYEAGSGLYVTRSSLGGLRTEIRMMGEKKNVPNVNR